MKVVFSIDVYQHVPEAEERQETPRRVSGVYRY